MILCLFVVEMTMSSNYSNVNGAQLSSLLLLCSVLVVVLEGFYLQGSRTSYVRLPRWHSCYNSSLTLDFRTSMNDALLLYADDGGQSSFLILSIDKGSVVARISVAIDDQATDHASTTLRVVSRPVNDRRWHTVRSN